MNRFRSMSVRWESLQAAVIFRQMSRVSPPAIIWNSDAPGPLSGNWDFVDGNTTTGINQDTLLTADSEGAQLTARGQARRSGEHIDR